MGEVKLKACPFCGGDGRIDHGGPHEPDEWCGLCSACDYSLPFKLTKSEAVTAWNTRSEGLQPPVGEVEEEVFSSLGASKAPSSASAGVAETPSEGR